MTVSGFISFGPELAFWAIVFFIAWGAFLLFQVATVIMTVREVLRRRGIRAAVWGLVAVVAILAYPAYEWVGLWQAEAAVKRAMIDRDRPDFAGKTVLYVPARTLDDVALSCGALVEQSGARAVYLAKPWFDPSAGEGEVPDDLGAPIDLLSLVDGRAEMGDYFEGVLEPRPDDPGQCLSRPTMPPDRIDYVVVENRFGDLTAPFAAHLERAGVSPERMDLVFLVAPVRDARAFRFGPETATLALFETRAVRPAFPFNPLFPGDPVTVPRDVRDFQRPIRQVVCREPVDAPEPVCWPFS